MLCLFACTLNIYKVKWPDLAIDVKALNVLSPTWGRGNSLTQQSHLCSISLLIPKYSLRIPVVYSTMHHLANGRCGLHCYIASQLDSRTEVI